MARTNHEVPTHSDVDSMMSNADLAPTTPDERNWGAWSYIAVWMGIAHNINQWILVASMLAIGMGFWEAAGAVFLAFSIVYIAVVLNGIVGAKYGLAFPPIVRSIFGQRGAFIPIILRSLSGILQLGVFVYVTGEGIAVAFGAVIPELEALGDHYQVIGMGLDTVLGYIIAFAAHAYILTHGIERIRRFELWAGPLIMVVAAGLFVWAIVVAGGILPITSISGSLDGAEFWGVFFISVAGLIGSMSSLIVNNPDITRFARSQKAQLIGQGIGLPVMFIVFSIITIVGTAGTEFAFGHIINDPLKILQEFGSPVVVCLGALCIAASTLSLNAATNAIAAGFDFTALFPRILTFNRSIIVSLFLGIVSVPWLWYGKGDFTTIVYGFLGVVMGPILGIMLADFYLIRRRKIDVGALSRTAGIYSYNNGWNHRAVTALTIGTIVALIGVIVRPLHVLYQFNWFLGVGTGALCYAALMWSQRDREEHRETTDGRKAEL